MGSSRRPWATRRWASSTSSARALRTWPSAIACSASPSRGRPRPSWRCCPTTRPIPPSLDFPGAAALPAAIETATRALDQLGVGSGSTLLINGASGSVGSAAVQLAVVRGARVIGTASPANHQYLRSVGAEPVAYGEGLVERVRALAPDGVDVALDVAGSGVLPELIELADGSAHVVTVADFSGAQEHGVAFSRGDAGRAVHVLAEIGELIEAGRFSLPVARTFPLAEIAEAHRFSEDGHVRGKLVLLVG